MRRWAPLRRLDKFAWGKTALVQFRIQVRDMKVSAIFLALYLASPWVSADIFKCRDAKGNDKYQNFPCPIDSIGSHATAVPPKEATNEPISAEAPAKPSGKRPTPGMKTDEVRAAWGVPTSTEVIADVESWHYNGPGFTRTVRFDTKGTVLLVTENRRSDQDVDGDDEP